MGILKSILCWWSGHDWPILFRAFGPEPGVAIGIGQCRRCGIVSVKESETCGCDDCGELIVRGDDPALICVKCGGRNRRAVLQ